MLTPNQVGSADVDPIDDLQPSPSTVEKLSEVGGVAITDWDLHALAATLRANILKDPTASPSLQTLAALRVPVDAFFEDVMVNAEALDLRLNRLGLLKSLHDAMNRVADLSKLAS